MILNQNVSITLQGPAINGFYPVDIQINERSVSQMLLSNDRNPPVISSSQGNKRSSTHFSCQLDEISKCNESTNGQSTTDRANPCRVSR